MRYLSVKVMKKTLLLFLLMSITIVSLGQEKLLNRGEVSAQAFVPTGNLAKTNYLGIGMSVEGETKQKNNLGIAFNSGYNYVLGKEGSKTIIQFPAYVGVKYHFGDMVSFGQFFGVNYITQGYGFSPATLTYLKIDGINFTTDIRYINSSIKNIISDFSGIGITIGYKF
jgi:hypothetical protein